MTTNKPFIQVGDRFEHKNYIYVVLEIVDDTVEVMEFSYGKYGGRKMIPLGQMYSYQHRDNVMESETYYE
jgi:hypothetical protein